MAPIHVSICYFDTNTWLKLDIADPKLEDQLFLMTPGA